jgi:putative peptide zinc metalloprotease protein
MQQRLPELRDELSVYAGPALAGGQPSWSLHDPVRHQFFQIDWMAYEMLSRWRMGDAARIVDDINASTTLDVHAEDVEHLLAFLTANQLLRPAAGAAPALAARRDAMRQGWGQWLLHNYLFMRLPLVRPDAWLSRWAPRLAFLYSRGFLLLTLAAMALGLIGIYRQWEQFAGTLVDHFTLQGAMAYGATLVVVKILHELGHGFTAKRHGCRVPSMGVALLVLWPVAYTDTNEVWKLSQRRQRLEVAAAGMATELIIAAWATLAWCLLPEGLARTAAFLMCTTTWISSIAINASPFMRFDGYFLLSDWLQIPNLHSRAFALARWDLRERLFRLGEEPPEYLAPGLRKGLTAFAWLVWIYRLVVFLGIAALVYHFFIKLAGIALFLVEIVWFIWLPIQRELLEWRKRRMQIKTQGRYRLSLALAAGALALFVLPWPTRTTVSGLMQPLQQMEVFAPAHGQLGGPPPANGSQVKAGEALMQIQSADLAVREQKNMARKQQLDWQADTASFDAQTRRDWQLIDEQRASVDAERGTVEADAKRYSPSASFGGQLKDVDPDLREGDWLSQGEPLGRVIGAGGWQVVAYVNEDEIARLAPGDRALFVADGMAGPVLRLRVSSIDKTASPVVREGALANLFGGDIAVREKKGVLYADRAIYRVALDVSGEPDERIAQHAWRGQVTLAGQWEAPGLRFVKAVTATLWRELGF